MHFEWDMQHNEKQLNIKSFFFLPKSAIIQINVGRHLIQKRCLHVQEEKQDTHTDE